MRRQTTPCRRYIPRTIPSLKAAQDDSDLDPVRPPMVGPGPRIVAMGEGRRDALPVDLEVGMRFAGLPEGAEAAIESKSAEPASIRIY
jgi:hypothetical protein